MNNYFIILAAGNSTRFNSKIPKQFISYKGLMLFEHSVNKAIKSNIFDKIILVINKKHSKYLKNYKNDKVVIIYGGRERYLSSLKSLKYIQNKKPKNVYIHDAARPNFSSKLLFRIKKALKKHNAVVPFLKPINTIKIKENKKIINFDRNNIYEIQTPQCFNFKILNKLSKANKKFITDECSLFLNKNIKVNFIKGEFINRKITSENDLEFTKKTYYGIGFDVHRLVPNRKLYLGGIVIKSKLGTLGHSDGDPVLHAITDAMLGACRQGDIGQKFSDKKKKYKNIRSTILLEKVVKEVKKNNYFINNLDINIITQTPKISNYKKKIIKSIASICDIQLNKINVKGKTTEKLGLIGKEKAIACEVIVSISQYD